MNSVFISIHVDGYYGLVEGVPNLLRLFKKYGIRATFFVNMGNEANLFELFYHRGYTRNGEREMVHSRYTVKQILRMLFFPRRLGNAHGNILREILRQGHELSPHCWSHRKWSKSFNTINHHREIMLMKKSFYKCTGHYPQGFSPPTWKTNAKVTSLLEQEGFSYLGTDRGTLHREGKLLVIPLSYPLNLEEMLGKKMSHEEIVSHYVREFDKEYSNVYFHADFEGLKGLHLFERILNLLKEKKTKTYNELLNTFAVSEKQL